MEKEAIPNLDVVSSDPDARRTEADRIIEDLKCVCLDEFSRVEREFLDRMEDAEFISEGQLTWMRRIQSRMLDRIL